MAPLTFKGVAHPPPRRDGKRDHPADLSRAEIVSSRLGSNGGTSLCVEHDRSARVGTVLSSWEGPGGELRVQGIVRDSDAASMVATGSMRGLSLGTGVTYKADGGVWMRGQDELSLCSEPRRGGCYIDEVDGKSVRSTHNASRGVPAKNPSRYGISPFATRPK